MNSGNAMSGAISENFVLSVCRLILRFPQFFTLVGGWGNSFPFFEVTKFLSLYQSAHCAIIKHSPIALN